jgi:HK97 family phage major capsid protein/HK97 family phage prohead protease
MSEFIETKAAFSVSDAGEITGVAWVFSKPDRVGDVITKQAFQNVRPPLPILFAHDQRQPIGVWESIEPTGDTLTVKGRLLLDTVEKAREVYSLIKAGALSGLSIGFRTKQSTTRPRGGRTISALDLVETSVVSVGAHPDARIISAKMMATQTNGESMENDNIDDVEVKTVDATEIESKFTSLETKLADLGALGSRLDKIEARLNRPGAPAIVTKQADAAEIEKKAFVDYARTGQIEKKALSVASNGGVLVPQVLLNEIQKNLVEKSPIRQIARVTSIGGQKVTLPKRTAGPTAYWVGETETRTESSSTYGSQDIEAYELAAYTDVSLQVLEDALFDLQSEIVKDMGEAFAKAEGSAFVSGDGTKVTGFLHSPAAGSIVDATTAAGGMPSADDFITAFYALPSDYARNAVWVLNRGIIGALRKMKTTSGDYIWHESPASHASLPFGSAGTLLGAPVVEAPDMPTLAASTVVAVIGDFKEAYRIVDRIGIDFLRDDFTQRTNGKVRFHARRRVGGEVVNSAALRFLRTTAAS